MKKRVHCLICKVISRLFGCNPSSTAFSPEPHDANKLAHDEQMRLRMQFSKAIRLQYREFRALSAQDRDASLAALADHKSTQEGDQS